MTARIISIDRSFIPSGELTLPLTLTSKGSEEARVHIHENYPTDAYRIFYHSIIDKQQPRHLLDRRLDPVVARIIELSAFAPLTSHLSDVLHSPSTLWVHQLTESDEDVEDFAVLLAWRLINDFNLQAKQDPRKTSVDVFSAFIDQLRSHVSPPTEVQRRRFDLAMTSPSRVDVWLRSVLLVGQDHKRMLVSFTSTRNIETIKRICSRSPNRVRANHHSSQSSSSSNSRHAVPSTRQSINLSNVPRLAVHSISQSSTDVVSSSQYCQLADVYHATEQIDQSPKHRSTTQQPSHAAPSALRSPHVSFNDEFDDMPSLEADDTEQSSEHPEQLTDCKSSLLPVLAEPAAVVCPQINPDIVEPVDQPSELHFVPATTEQSADMADSDEVADLEDDATHEQPVIIDENVSADDMADDDDDDVIITHAVLTSPSRPSLASPFRSAPDIIRLLDGDDEYYVQYVNEQHEVDESDSDVSRYDQSHDEHDEQDEQDEHGHNDYHEEQLDMEDEDNNDESSQPMSTLKAERLSIPSSDAEDDEHDDSHFSSFVAFDDQPQDNDDGEDNDSVDQSVDKESAADQLEHIQASNQASNRSRYRKPLKVWQYQRSGGARIAQNKLGKWMKFVMKTLADRVKRGKLVTSYKKLLAVSLVRPDGAKMLRQALLQLQHAEKIVFLLPEDVQPGRYITDSVLQRVRLELP